MTDPVFGTRLIGQTERALDAILHRLLIGSDVTAAGWIALNLIAGPGTHEPEVSTEMGDALIARGLVARSPAGLVPSAAGEALLRRIRADVAQVTERLWGDMDVDDLTTAARVLTVVKTRAVDELRSPADGDS